VIQYRIHGTILATGAKYGNRFCSAIELGKREDHALKRLHGLACGLERTDGKHPLIMQEA
jgi:hypothetical protein